jgi:hypothetical protein
VAVTDARTNAGRPGTLRLGKAGLRDMGEDPADRAARHERDAVAALELVDDPRVLAVVHALLAVDARLEEQTTAIVFNS